MLPVANDLHKTLISYYTHITLGAGNDILAAKRAKVIRSLETLKDYVDTTPQVSQFIKQCTPLPQGFHSPETVHKIINALQPLLGRPHNSIQTSQASIDEKVSKNHISLHQMVLSWKDNEFTSRFLNLPLEKQEEFLEMHFGFDSKEIQLEVRAKLIPVFRSILHSNPKKLFAWITCIPDQASRNVYTTAIIGHLAHQPLPIAKAIVEALDQEQQKEVVANLPRHISCDTIETVLFLLRRHLSANEANKYEADIARFLSSASLHYGLKYFRCIQDPCLAGSFLRKMLTYMHDLTDAMNVNNAIQEHIAPHDQHEAEKTKRCLAVVVARMNLSKGLELAKELSQLRDIQFTYLQIILFSSNQPFFIPQFLALDPKEQSLLLSALFNKRHRMAGPTPKHATRFVKEILRHTLQREPKKFMKWMSCIENPHSRDRYIKNTIADLMESDQDTIANILNSIPENLRKNFIRSLIRAVSPEQMQQLLDVCKEFTAKETLEEIVINLVQDNNDENITNTISILYHIHDNITLHNNALASLIEGTKSGRALNLISQYIDTLEEGEKNQARHFLCRHIARFNTTQAIRESQKISDLELEISATTLIFLSLLQKEYGFSLFLQLPFETQCSFLDSFICVESGPASPKIDQMRALIVRLLENLALKNPFHLCHLLDSIEDVPTRLRFAHTIFPHLTHIEFSERQKILENLPQHWQKTVFIAIVNRLSTMDHHEEVDAHFVHLNFSIKRDIAIT